jgi:hypothetical protein
MDGKHEVPKGSLPIRKKRGTNEKLKDKTFTVVDPRKASWRMLRRDRWDINRKSRNEAVYYLVK